MVNMSKPFQRTVQLKNNKTFKATATTQDGENLSLPEQKAALPAEDRDNPCFFQEI